MVYEGFLYALKKKVSKNRCLKPTFDPTLHHAVQTVPVEEGQEADRVVQVYQKGYNKRSCITTSNGHRLTIRRRIIK